MCPKYFSVANKRESKLGLIQILQVEQFFLASIPKAYAHSLSDSKWTHFPSPFSNNVTVNYQLLECKQA